MIGVGDLVVCVKRGPWRGNKSGRVIDGPVNGATYTVVAVGRTSSGLGLDLHGVETLRNCFGAPILWNAERFRKIKPDEHEPCEAEFVTLLNRTRTPVEAGQDGLVGFERGVLP